MARDGIVDALGKAAAKCRGHPRLVPASAAQITELAKRLEARGLDANFCLPSGNDGAFTTWQASDALKRLDDDILERN